MDSSVCGGMQVETMEVQMSRMFDPFLWTSLCESSQASNRLFRQEEAHRLRYPLASVSFRVLITSNEEEIYKKTTITPLSQRLIQLNKGITADNMELEFEQELTDTYSALFVEMDPGDYFNFECEFAKGFNSDDDCNLQNLTNSLNNGGLESRRRGNRRMMDPQTRQHYSH
ncbi:hypothetical protein DY000_02033681 [Brassica cretica]|uniref:Uncharacterized protein n=1 Tax=Brassica cretica TaxID=69181 RepID=A0ABQ7DJN5_BRACR|nr:hypothetical protein DY000_02033681 [Brassica cretica]